ncbi:MAG: DUF3105 domain-containing protein [Candidatus Doudnabacteria bacterium]
MKNITTVLIIVVLFVGFGIFLLKNDKTPTQEQILKGYAVELQPATHIDVGASHDPYNSNPPTSGPHYVQQADWGVYEKPLLDEQLIHNLEHGGIWISYKDIDEQTKRGLESIARENPGSVVVAPRPNNDSKIALASWGRLQKLDNFNEAEILSFIKSNINNSPEKLAD